MNATLRNFALWVIIALLLLALFTLFQNPGSGPRIAGADISFSQFLVENESGKVREVVIRGKEIHGSFNDGRGSFQTYAPNGVNITERTR
jgi:cell division protease FtsH